MFVIEVTVNVGADHSFVVAAISGRLDCANKMGPEVAEKMAVRHLRLLSASCKRDGRNGLQRGGDMCARIVKGERVPPELAGKGIRKGEIKDAAENACA